jgi:hypothetical protein
MIIRMNIGDINQFELYNYNIVIGNKNMQLGALHV